MIFGNGGSRDRCQRLGDRLRRPAGGHSRPVPAVSLAMEPATVTAIANDVGTDVVFLRQLIAQARPDDVAIGDLDQRRLAQRRSRRWPRRGSGGC